MADITLQSYRYRQITNTDKLQIQTSYKYRQITNTDKVTDTDKLQIQTSYKYRQITNRQVRNKFVSTLYVT